MESVSGCAFSRTIWLSANSIVPGITTSSWRCFTPLVLRPARERAPAGRGLLRRLFAKNPDTKAPLRGRVPVLLHKRYHRLVLLIVRRFQARQLAPLLQCNWPAAVGALGQRPASSPRSPGRHRPGSPFFLARRERADFPGKGVRV